MPHQRHATGTRREGAHKVPFFFGPPFAYASLSVFVCARCARGTVVDLEWLLGVIWQAEEPANPETHGCFVSSCALLLIARVCARRHNGRISRFELNAGMRNVQYARKREKHCGRHEKNRLFNFIYPLISF